MMAIVVALLGAFRCGAVFALKHDGTGWNIVFGAMFVVFGLALLVMFRRVAQMMASGAMAGTGIAKHLPRIVSLGTAILALGTLTMLSGAAGAVVAWHNPFSWMTAIVGIAIFVDTLCLRISLSLRR